MSANAECYLLAARVARDDMSAEERNELAVKALADIEKLWEDYDDSLKITYTHNRAMLLSLRGEHAAALKNAFQYGPNWRKKMER